MQVQSQEKFETLLHPRRLLQTYLLKSACRAGLTLFSTIVQTNCFGSLTTKRNPCLKVVKSIKWNWKTPTANARRNSSSLFLTLRKVTWGHTVATGSASTWAIQGLPLLWKYMITHRQVRTLKDQTQGNSYFYRKTVLLPYLFTWII